MKSETPAPVEAQGSDGNTIANRSSIIIGPPTAQEFSMLPLDIVEAKRWLLHKNKRPFYVDGSPRRGRLDSPEDQSRFGYIADALAPLSSGIYSGLGFALGPDGTGNYWQGVDFDRAEYRDLALSVGGYVELSPSGRGYHCIGYGRWFPALGSNDTGIEAYCQGRFFTITGRAVAK